jgi:hypothetical protein
MIRYHLLLCLGLLSAASSACSLVVDSDRVQCKTPGDCAARGASAGSVCIESICQPDPTWSCLDQPNTDAVASPTVHVVFTGADLLSQKPLPGIRLTLCAKLDADCVMPIAQYQSDQAGQLNVEMPAGFDGYFQTEGDGIYPTLFFPPNTRKQRAPSTLPMVPVSFFGTMFSGIGGAISADRTVIMTTALDCLGRPAAGMVLSSPQADDRTVTYFLQGGLPSRTALTTDQDGAGGFVNVKAGGAVVTSTMAASNRQVGTVAVQTRPGHLTMVLVLPTGS